MTTQYTSGPWKARDYRADNKSIWIDCDAWTKAGAAIALAEGHALTKAEA